MIRLDKYLADTGAASRREAKAYIRRGEVTVDGVPARAPEQKIAETAVVCLRGQILRYQAYHYYMLHKPAGVLTATADRSRPVVSLSSRPAGTSPKRRSSGGNRSSTVG